MRYLWASFSIPFEVYMERPVDVTFESAEGNPVRVRLRRPAPGELPPSVVDEEHSTWMGMRQKDVVSAEHFTHAEVWFAPPWLIHRLTEDVSDAEAAAALKAMLREGPDQVLSIVNHLLRVAARVSRQFQLRPLVRDDIRDWVTGEADQLEHEPHATGLMAIEPSSDRPRVCRNLDDVLPEVERALDRECAVPEWSKVLADAEWLNELGHHDAAIVLSHVALELRLNELLRCLSGQHGSGLSDIVQKLCKGLGVPSSAHDKLRLEVRRLEVLRNAAAHGGRGRQPATWAGVREYHDTARRVAEYFEAACSDRDR